MKKKVVKKKPATLPRGYRTLTASLAVADVAGLLAFLNAAFGAEIQFSDNAEDPTYAAVALGNARLLVTRGWGPHRHLPAIDKTHSAVSQHMYVEDVDQVIGKALDAGAELLAEPRDMYWGERCAAIADPYGHLWTIATRLENLTADEIAERRDQAIAAAESEALPAEDLPNLDSLHVLEEGYKVSPHLERATA